MPTPSPRKGRLYIAANGRVRVKAHRSKGRSEHMRENLLVGWGQLEMTPDRFRVLEDTRHAIEDVTWGDLSVPAYTAEAAAYVSERYAEELLAARDRESRWTGV